MYVGITVLIWQKLTRHFSELQYTFFYKKIIFLPEPQFSYGNPRNYADFFLTFFLTSMSLFSLIVCLIDLTLNEDGTTINAEDRKES